MKRIWVAKKKHQFKKDKVDLKIAEIIRKRGFTHKAISYICTYKNNTTYGDLFKFYSKLPPQYVELLNIELLPQEIKNVNADISGYYSENLEDNLNSMLVSFKLHKEKINKFINKKQKFEIEFSFALLYDISLFLKMSHGKYWEKFIYLTFSVLAYFSYLHAEAFAKYSIYMETGVKADYFQTALAYFKGIYFVPSIILMISFMIAGAIFIVIILSYMPLFIDMFPSTWKEKLKPYKETIYAYITVPFLGINTHWIIFCRQFKTF